jgi:hypothetical protein
VTGDALLAFVAGVLLTNATLLVSVWYFNYLARRRKLWKLNAQQEARLWVKKRFPDLKVPWADQEEK